MYVWALVSSDDTATPASISVAGLDRRLRPPISHVTTTAAMAPTNASSGVHDGVDTLLPSSAIANVAPSPAPAATPSRYGSANGLRKTP